MGKQDMWHFPVFWVNNNKGSHVLANIFKAGESMCQLLCSWLKEIK